MIAQGDTLALVKVKNSRHGLANPNARYRKLVSAEEILASPMVSNPLRLLQICATSDGGAALVLFRRSLGHVLESQQVPFLLPAVPDLVGTGLVSVLLCCGVGLAGGLLPAWRAGRREPYELIRGEGA